MKTQRSLGERLAYRRMLVGLVQTHPGQLLIELADRCAYDFLFLDKEHGVFSEDEYLRTVRAVAATNVLCLARLAGHDPDDLRRCLAAGPDAIVIPHVATAVEATALVRAMDDASDTALIVIIESALGVSNAESILAIHGVDGAFVGPSDLSADLGRTGDYRQPGYEEALLHVEQAAVVTGKLLGTAVHADYSPQALHSRGYHLVVLGSDASLMQQAMTAQITSTRSTPEIN
jgi:4-hydroxy-2-oxoheptanedioate aldolase